MPVTRVLGSQQTHDLCHYAAWFETPDHIKRRAGVDAFKRPKVIIVNFTEPATSAFGC